MTESDISTDRQPISDNPELSNIKNKLYNGKSDTESNIVNERVKPSPPIYKARIGPFLFGIFIIIGIIAIVYDSGFNYALDNGAGIGCSLTIGISLLFAKYCENPLPAIVYFLKKRPHTYSELKNKIGSYRFAYEAELDYLKERGQISYSYTGKRDTRVISLVDDDL